VCSKKLEKSHLIRDQCFELARFAECRPEMLESFRSDIEAKLDGHGFIASRT